MRRKRIVPWQSLAVPRKESGFTVIEIIIAVALSALLLTIVYGTYFSITDPSMLPPRIRTHSRPAASCRN